MCEFRRNVEHKLRSAFDRLGPRRVAVLQPRLVAAEDQVLAHTGFQVGLKSGDESVVLVADRRVCVLEDRRRTGGRGFVGHVQRRGVLVHGDRPPRHIAGVDAEQFTVGDGARDHDVREQRVDDDHGLQRLPLFLGNVFEVENPVEREDKSVVGAEGVEHRAVTAGDRRERRLVHRREVVVLGERVDRQLPVDRAVEHLLTQRRPPADAPRVEFFGQRPEKGGDVQRRVLIERNPQETRTFGRRQFGQPRCAR